MYTNEDKKIILFNNLELTISKEDWEFLCKYRFFTETPTEEHIQAEFVSGTGITKNKTQLWEKANERFAEYIADLKEIQLLDINTMAQKLLTEEEKYVEIKKPANS